MRILKAGVVLVFLIMFGLFIYSLPPVRGRLEWRLVEIQAQIKYAISPPNEAIFVPQEQDLAKKTSLISPPTNSLSNTPTLTKEVQPTVSPTPLLSPTLTPSPMSALSPTPRPEQVVLNGVPHEYQTWNNCGPATLAMGLSYFGEFQTQNQTNA